ncbi:DEP domain-containing protein 1B-like [Sinocyclocheilus rhinocerous]|uniref:DEP domain-containing protein 1B-like n=1 Tax=Sinocyclocheilus rhinocerous TaxID=307959 RepID=UPI0007B887F9|nr:PREDICTED: DEP domain-containing protein 1B-like [Sinocyclocheilus rhinocerous]
MDGKMIGPGPYRATKLWNETIRLLRGGMPVRRHWAHFRSYDHSFTGAEAVDFLHELLRRNQNFGPEVTRYQTLQLLRKFFKNHVIEDVKGRCGKEDFEDSGHLYRFPPQSPLKPVPVRPPVRDHSSVPRIPRWDDFEEISVPEKIPVKPLMNSESWNKRHSIAIGEVPECRLIRRRELTPKHVDQIWKSMTLTHLQTVLGLQSLDGVLDAKLLSPKHIVHNVFGVNKQGIVVLKNKAENLPHWVLSAMKCLANWPNGNDARQPMYPGFERDVFRTVAEHFQRLKEPLLTFHLYEIFVSILGAMVELLENIIQDKNMSIKDKKKKLKQLIYILNGLKIKYAGADTDTTMASPPHSFCRQISREEFEQQRVSGSQGAMVELLENIIRPSRGAGAFGLESALGVCDGSPEYPEAEAEEGAASGVELFQVRRRSSRNLQLPPLVFRQAEQHDWNSKETEPIARPTTLALRTPPLIAITSADAGRSCSFFDGLFKEAQLKGVSPGPQADG